VSKITIGPRHLTQTGGGAAVYGGVVRSGMRGSGVLISQGVCFLGPISGTGPPVQPRKVLETLDAHFESMRNMPARDSIPRF
jgi:hypothetical protein